MTAVFSVHITNYPRYLHQYMDRPKSSKKQVVSTAQQGEHREAFSPRLFHRTTDLRLLRTLNLSSDAPKESSAPG